jgi:putative transposase
MVFVEVWSVGYPAIVRLWDNAWAEFVPFLALDPVTRRVICSTNAMESANVRIRRAVNTRSRNLR